MTGRTPQQAKKKKRGHRHTPARKQPRRDGHRPAQGLRRNTQASAQLMGGHTKRRCCWRYAVSGLSCSLDKSSLSWARTHTESKASNAGNICMTLQLRTLQHLLDHTGITYAKKRAYDEYPLGGGVRGWSPERCGPPISIMHKQRGSLDHGSRSNLPNKAPCSDHTFQISRGSNPTLVE